jgi:ribonucleoside-triphosphate reductase
VVGYLRPVQNFNKGKKAEYVDRVKYVIKNDEIGLGDFHS